MNRRLAEEQLRRLAGGLFPDAAGVRRLLERVSTSDEPEVLRDLLIEGGALAILDGSDGPPSR